jgi:hypothetical protein
VLCERLRNALIFVGGGDIMLIGLHDADKEHMKQKTFPNFALMKIAAYFKSVGVNTVEWWNPVCNNDYDFVYSSKIFDYTSENKYLPKQAKPIPMHIGQRMAFIPLPRDTD